MSARVLLVDDDEKLSEMLRDYLGRAGYEVETRLDAASGLAASRRLRPDVLILGQALSGGMYPVSAVLADDEVMLTIQPGQHGSMGTHGRPRILQVPRQALPELQEDNPGSLPSDRRRPGAGTQAEAHRGQAQA